MQLRKKIPGIAKTTTKNILSIIYFRFIDKRKRFIIPGVGLFKSMVAAAATLTLPSDRLPNEAPAREILFKNCIRIHILNLEKKK